ncbi:hypothetical protein KUTeg_002772 [Tegillarca granosa]|uniref:C1q domain-containing protein n=1 Tax=Tegillarca granosa TaxID=220873 RepID=A0ABQ9FUN6_TEGGR|nr:hypothetical protein KUTeg_002772 [Tegillarca granosa]
MVAEHLERKQLLKEFRAIKIIVSDVRRKLKVKTNLLQETKILQNKLLRDVKDMKENVKKVAHIAVKKALKKVNRRFTNIEKRESAFSNMILNTNFAIKGLGAAVNITHRRLSGVKQRCNFILKEVKDLKMKSVGILVFDYLLLSTLQIKKKQRVNNELNFLLKLLLFINNHWKQIAFSVWLFHSPTTSSALVFKKIITNIGGGYNVNNGMFNCRKNGIYTFAITLEGRARVNTYGSLMKNNQQVAYIHEHGAPGGYQSVSVTVAVRLVYGDKVWVKGTGISLMCILIAKWFYRVLRVRGLVIRGPNFVYEMEFRIPDDKKITRIFSIMI